MTASKSKMQSSDLQSFLIASFCYLMLKSVITPLIMIMIMIGLCSSSKTRFTFVFNKPKNNQRSFAKNVVVYLIWLMSVISMVYLCFSMFGITMLLPVEPVHSYVPIEDKKSREKDKLYMEKIWTLQSSIQISKEDVSPQIIKKKTSHRPKARKLTKLKTRQQRKARTVHKYTPCGNQSLQPQVNLYENGPLKFIEHHHGETKKFIDSKACSFLYDQFQFDPSNFRNPVTMVTTPDNNVETEAELQHLHLGNTRALLANTVQPMEELNHRQQSHQEYSVGPTVDLDRYRSPSRGRLTSLLTSRTSSGFNSLTVYDEHDDDLTPRRNNIPFQSGATSRQSVYRPTISSGYESGLRGQVSSGGISMSLRIQVDRHQNEDRSQNICHTGSNIPTSDQYCSSENQEVLSRSQDILIGESTTETAGYLPRLPEVPAENIVRTTRQDESQATGNTERNAAVSLRQNVGTERKMVGLKMNGAECSAHTSFDNHMNQCIGQNPKENCQFDDTFQELGAHGTDSNQELKKKSTLDSSTFGLPHDLPNDRYEKLSQERRSNHRDVTERSIHSSHRTNDHNHRSSTHYGNFDRIQHNSYRSPNQGNGRHTTNHVPEQETGNRWQITDPPIDEDDLFGDGPQQIIYSSEKEDVDSDQRDSEDRSED